MSVFCIQPITFYFLVYSLYVVSQVVLQLAEGHIYNAHMRKINLLMQLSEINFQKYSSKKRFVCSFNRNPDLEKNKRNTVGFTFLWIPLFTSQLRKFSGCLLTIEVTKISSGRQLADVVLLRNTIHGSTLAGITFKGGGEGRKMAQDKFFSKGLMGDFRVGWLGRYTPARTLSVNMPQIYYSSMSQVTRHKGAMGTKGLACS